MQSLEIPVKPDTLSEAEQLSLISRRLIIAAMELIGGISEYKSMPCDSLEQRMFTTLERQSLRVKELQKEYNTLGGLDQKLLAVVPLKLYTEALDAIGDPEKVFINMKSGAIAKPSLRNMVDLYGEVVNGEDALLLELARLRAENERLSASNAALSDASNDLLMTFQHTLEIGYERIVNMGGHCDTPEQMINQEPAIKAMKRALLQQ